MIFATLLLLSPVSLFGDVVLPAANPAPIVAAASITAVSAPSMPQPKPEVMADALAAEPAAAQPAGFALEPVKPATRRSYDNPNEVKVWYALMAAGHAGAAFDAWSTRRALSGNWGTEADPLMRPFAHSGAVYAATQVTPLVMDFIGRRSMVSTHPWVRKMWWVPQAAGASISFSTAIHNVGVVH
jgi:hypothetical protein